MKKLITTLMVALAMSAFAVQWSDIGIVTADVDGTRVTVTNNVTQTVQFMDDLGEVVLDLNGHAITGTTASAGIQIGHGAGTGIHLKIVDSRQTCTSTVCGGDGIADVTGGAGIDVATNAVNILVSVGAYVMVKGGDGGSADGDGEVLLKGNNGGLGVHGNVSENLGMILGGKGGVGYGAGHDGGIGVLGDVLVNRGTISGGCGGASANIESPRSDGGNGGAGVVGTVVENGGTISGGTGGEGVDSGGTGGVGVQGSVATNLTAGVISGGCGGSGVFGVGSDGGVGVDGDVGVNNGTISGGGGCSGDYSGGGNGGTGIKGNVTRNNGVIWGGDGGSTCGGGEGG